MHYKTYLIVLLSIVISLQSQNVNSQDSLKTLEATMIKKRLIRQLSFRTNEVKDYHISRLNDLHRPLFLSFGNLPYGKLNIEYDGYYRNQRLNNLFNLNHLYEEMVDSIRIEGNSIILEKSEIDHYLPVSNLIIDEGDFLFSYVDAFIKRRLNDDFAMFIGFRNVTSEASFENQLENPQFKIGVDYRINDDMTYSTSYFLNRLKYKDIGPTEISDDGATIQVLNQYFRKRSYRREWLNRFTIDEFEFEYTYSDQYEKKGPFRLDTLKQVNVFDHHFAVFNSFDKQHKVGFSYESNTR